MSLYIDMDFRGFCLGAAARVEEIYWVNKKIGESTQIQRRAPDLGLLTNDHYGA
jgi:hypothetical protein